MKNFCCLRCFLFLPMLIVVGCNGGVAMATESPTNVPEPFIDENHDGVCFFDTYSNFSFATVSSGTAYYVAGDNNLYSVQIESSTTDNGFDSIMTYEFATDYRFVSVVSSVGTPQILALQDANGDIVVAQVGQDGPIQVDTIESTPSQALSISTDGKWIGIYESNRFSNMETSGIRIFNWETSEEIILKDEYLDHSLPVWAPDGKRIAFAIYDDTSSRVHILDIDSKSMFPLSDPGECHTNIAWSPDSNYLVVNTANNHLVEDSYLIVFDVETSEILTSTRINQSERFIDNISGWSPSGDYIMFEAYEYDKPRLNICLIAMQSWYISCPFLIRDKLTVPFWMETDDGIGLLKFEAIDKNRFGGIPIINIEDIEARSFEEIDISTTDMNWVQE